jgi:hypothetical protein
MAGTKRGGGRGGGGGSSRTSCFVRLMM